MKISSLSAVLTQLIVCMCVAYISYIDNCPPTLNFKQNVIVQNSLHFLPGYGVHQQFLEHREHPYRMQMDDEVGHRRIDFGMLPLHGREPRLDQFRRTVGIILAEAFQRRTLRMEQQDSHQCAVLVNQRNIFVYTGFQVCFRPHHHNILAPYAVVFLQHGFQSAQDRTDYFMEQFIFVREVVVDISDANLGQFCYFAHGSLGIAFLLELLPGNRQYATSYVFFQHLHL